MVKYCWLILVIISSHGFCQPGKEGYHWRFGNRGGLDFSSGTPVQESSPLYVMGGSSSISDRNTGQYLFSVAGNKIYDRFNNVMTNGAGLFTTTNSTQSSLIIPKPGNTSIYYVITADQAGSTNKGVNYSIVDMSLQGGLGAVTVKNKPLTPAGATEKLIAVKNCTGTKYWIISHTYNSDLFNAYLLDSIGLDTVPVTSAVGTVHQNLSSTYLEATGYLKASPDGSKLALGICSDSIRILEILDFNNATGVVSNPITINYPSNIIGPYGLSFSPDSKKLYAGVFPNGSTCRLYQYDLSSGVPSTITASQTQIYQTQVTFINSYGRLFNGMQLGPDGKIYIACTWKDTLSVITNPNGAGLSCNFQINGPTITNNSASCIFGLPNFIDASNAGIQLNITDVEQCNTFTTASLDAGPGYLNYNWSTGDTTQTTSINSPGTYWVTVTNNQGCARTDTVTAYLITPDNLDTAVCDTFPANVTRNGSVSYLWSDNATNPIRDLVQSGQYWVDIAYASGCVIRDSIELKVYPSPSIYLGSDTMFCIGNLSISAFNPASNYIWSTGETTPIIIATKPGIYWVTVIDTNGCSNIDSLVIAPHLKAFDFNFPNIITPNNDGINDYIDFSSYQFTSMQFDVFNRWGKLIYSADDIQSKWTPKDEDGSYFYVLSYKIECANSSREDTKKGYVTIIR